MSDAIALLLNINKAASVPLRKTIESAAANAINNHGFKEEGLYISELQINDSIKLKDIARALKAERLVSLKEQAQLL